MASLISHDTKEETEIPVGETIIGRGPFLKVIETKVSRKHGVIAFDNDGIRIKPIHKNPTFLYNKIKQTWQPLVQDEWCTIQHGDLISLLPDTLQFEIKLKNQEEEKESDANITEHDNVTNDINLATSAKQFESTAHKTSFVQDIATAPSHKPKKGSELPSEKKVCDIKKKEQLPRKRQLPSWMLEAESSTSKKKESKKRATKRTEKEENDGEIEIAAKKRKTTKVSSPKGDNQSGDPPREKVKIPLESSESPGEKEEISIDPPVTKLGKCSRESPPKQSKPSKLPPVRIEPSRDLLSDLMGLSSSETVKHSSIPDPVNNTDVDISESGSVLSQLMDHKKYKKEPIENSEEIGELQQGEKTKKDKKEAEDEDKNGKNLIKKTKNLPSCPYGAKCYRRNPVHFQEYSHDDGTKDNENSDDNDDRPECQYGRSCYRTNPQHKRDFKHTKDLTKRSPVKKRTTASRAAKGKSVLDGDSDDDGEGNTYDYDDSFIDDDNDDDDGNETGYGDNGSDDEDYQPEDEDDESENLSELVSEAKDFVNNKN